MSQHPNFMDNLTAKAEELELPRKAKDLVDATAKLAQSAFDQARGYAENNKDKVEGFLDKAAAKVDEQTDGKYHDKVTKARESASTGFQKFTDRASRDADAATPVDEPSPTAWESATDGGTVGTDAPKDNPLA